MNRRIMLICLLGLLAMWAQPFLSAIGLDWFHKSKPLVRVQRSVGLRGYYENNGEFFYVEGRPAELRDFYEVYVSKLLPECDARDGRIRYMMQTNERLRLGATSQGMLFRAYAADITGNNKYAIAVSYAIHATHCTIVKSPRIISN